MLRTTSLVLFAALSAAAVAQQATPATDSVSQKPSALITPALNATGKAGSSVDLNKWKGSNAMREEVDANLASMQKDLQTTLPTLISASDAAPNSAAAALPVLLNVDALYAVLLRVTIASRTGAPKDQNAQLEQAAITLDNARRELGSRIAATVAADEKAIVTLKAAAVTLQATAAEQAEQLKALQAQAAATAAPKKPVNKRAVAKPVAPATQPAQ